MDCEHYFDIPATDDAVCGGVCRHCGLTREFKNRLTIEDKPQRRKMRPEAKSVLVALTSGAHVHIIE